MKRSPSAFALLLLCLSVPALGQDPRVFDVTKEPTPAVAGASAAAGANSGVVERLIARESAGGPFVVHFPSGTWTVARTIVLPSHAALRGAGRDLTTIQTVSGSSAPVVLTGLRPSYKGSGVHAEDVVPTALKGVAGVGIRLGRLHLTIPYQAWSFPTIPDPAAGQGWDRWDRTTAFTLDLAIDVGEAGVADDPTRTAPIAGMAAGPDLAPFGFWAGQGAYHFRIQTSDGVRHKVAFKSDARGLVRFSLMADVGKGAMRVLVDGVPVPIAIPSTLKPGMTFAANPGVPFKVNGMAEADGAQTDFSSPLQGDGFALHGLMLSRGVRWPEGAAPGSDEAVYRKPGDDAIAYLPMNDDPAQVVATRMIRSYNGVKAGGSRGVGYLMDASVQDNYASESDVTIRDVALSNSTWYGHCYAQALSLSTNLRDMAAYGGAVGCGVIDCGANYVTAFDGDCRFSGAFHVLEFRDAIVDATNARISTPVMGYGINVIDSKRSELKLGSLYFLGYQTASTREFVRVDGRCAIRSLLVDNETTGGAMETVIHATTYPFVNLNTLIVEDLNVAGISAGSSLMILDGAAATPGVVRVGAATVGANPKMKAWYDVRNPKWSGSLAQHQSIPGVPFMIAVPGTSNVRWTAAPAPGP